LRELQLDIDHISHNALWTNLYAQRLGKSAKFVVFVEAITLPNFLPLQFIISFAAILPPAQTAMA
jgi:hypothetical protein